MRPTFRTWIKHLILLLITLCTATVAGVIFPFGRIPFNVADPQNSSEAIQLAINLPLHYLNMIATAINALLTDSRLLTDGLSFSLSLLFILLSHEMGHYIACRRYQLDATLPYFLPLYLGPVGLQIGTLGAVIRIREPFPTRKVLFDVGIAGPIAGFVVLVPALFIGMYMSTLTISPPPETLTFIGKPLLFRLARWLVFGPIPEGSIVNLHPMVFAAWFGMLATALNLLPFGQLDGGHITYATLGRASTPISLVTVASALVMTYLSRSWLLMTVLMVFMLVMFGPRHPPVLNEYEPLGVGRQRLALFALAMLLLCFTPFPIDL